MQQPSPDQTAGREAGTATAEDVVAIARELALELHPQRRQALDTGLDSDLDRDLGYDSLGRAELLLRLERRFGIALPDRLISEAATPADLFAALQAARPDTTRAVTIATTAASALPAADGAAPEAPHRARTLLDAFLQHARTHPDRPHVTLWDRDGPVSTLTYGELDGRARRLAGSLVELGLETGARVSIMLPTGEGFFIAFIGVLMAGGVPVPVYPPFRRAQIEEHIRRQAKILNNCEASFLVTDDEIRPAGQLLYGLVPSLRGVKTVDELLAGAPLAELAVGQPGDMALIQYTSGSTGDPKGVVLSNANLLANVRAMGEAMGASSRDSVVSWLPLYHDMGLIGTWLGALYFAAPTCIMSPLNFIANPTRWLRALSERRATISSAPNFAYELCLRRIADKDIEGIDLSSLRRVINGAEPISPDTLRRFIERFGKFGFPAEAMAPSYGLAENAVGLAFPPLGRKPLFDRVDRLALSTEGVARPVAADALHAVEFVACGQPLPGHQIRILDETGREAGERQQGRLQFRGPSSTRGYYRNPAKTEALFDGDWLESGDLAYIAAGDIYITGRIKDLIIRAGRNIYPHEIEDAVGEVDGVRKGCVAAFASTDPRSGSERLVVMAETRLTDPAAREDLHKRIGEAVLATVDLPPDEVVLAAPRSVPKTSSGKIRRTAARDMFERGVIDASGAPQRWQLLQLAASGALGRGRRALGTVAKLAYAGYWWGCLAIIGAVAWLAVMIEPRRARRHRIIGSAGRLLFFFTGMKLTVEGTLPPSRRGAIVVANHASYLDGLIVSAALPAALSFVVTERFSRQFIAGSLLRRIGTQFVTGAIDKGAAEKQQTLDLMNDGALVVSFPEGRVRRMPGLLSFYMGPFLTAAEAGAPVIPVAISGARSALRNGGHWFPRRGPLHVRIGAPLPPAGNDFAAALDLRDRARAEILTHCGEPDLDREQADFGLPSRE